jgi:DNA-binding FrmR family transcriptional regulator
MVKPYPRGYDQGAGQRAHRIPTEGTKMAGQPSDQGTANGVERPVKMVHTISDEEAIASITKRLKRAQGQIGGVIAMLEAGRSCDDIVAQLAAVSKAVDRAAFSLIATGLKECLTSGDENADELSERLQRLFLTMA